MFGTILKYTVVAFIGAVTHGVIVNYIDDCAYETIKAEIDEEVEKCKAAEMDDATITTCLAAFILKKRQEWGKLYRLKETDEAVQKMYSHWM